MKAVNRLFITDLDGTLLRNDTSLSNYSVMTLNKLLKNGMLFTFSTARSFHTASRLLEGIRLSIPCIIFNGACLIDPRTGEHLIDNFINKNLLKDILKKGKEIGLFPFLFGRNGEEEIVLHTTPQNKGQQLYLKNREGDKRLRFSKDIHLLEQNITVNYIARKDDLLPFKEWVVQTFQNSVKFQFAEDIYLSGYYTLEFYHPNANKGTMLCKLSERLEIPLQQITVFGDNLNDLDMFKIAGHRIAVSNAHEDVLNDSDEVIESNDSDGVVRYLDCYFKNITS